MQNLVRYRAMESLCRQGAVFHPLESWRLLAQAEMWHHKAQDEMALHSEDRDHVSAFGATARTDAPGTAHAAIADRPSQARRM
jgi:hypothetical protein